MKSCGLDCGTNSNAWALYDDEEEILFDGGVDISSTEKDREGSSGRGSSLQAKRSNFKSCRKQGERRRWRKNRLKNLCEQNGIPLSLGNPRINVYKTRKRAVEGKISLIEIGIVFYKLNKLRGYKSNARIDSNSSTDELGVVQSSIEEIRSGMENAGALTEGQYFAAILDNGGKVRGRFTAREDNENEFIKIWAEQSKYYSFLTLKLFEDFYKAIFFQRELKSQEEKIGECCFEEGEKRCRKNNIYYQELVVRQLINDLKIIGDSEDKNLTSLQKESLYRLFIENEEVSFAKMRSELGLKRTVKFNFEREKKKVLKGNIFEARMRKVFGENWDGIPIEDKEILNQDLIMMDGWDIYEKYTKIYGFEKAFCLKSCLLSSGIGSMSIKAIKKLLPLLRAGLSMHDAREECGYNEQKEISGAGILKITKEIENISNSYVRSQIQRAVATINKIIEKHGRPDRFVIEMCRELTASPKDRARMESINAENEKLNKELREKLKKECGIERPNSSHLRKARLWKEQNGKSFYSGREILFSELFNGRIHSDHIVPLSNCEENSQANQVLCYQSENMEKSNKHPLDIYNKEELEAMISKMGKDFPRSKKGRILSREKAETFLNRQINDTSYITKIMANLLRQSGSQVICCSSAVVSKMRQQWDFRKDREDHRHHFEDACLLSIVDYRLIQGLANSYRGNYHFEIEMPDNFLQQIDAIRSTMIVRHKKNRKMKGELHDQTNYGNPILNSEGEIEYFPIRKSIESLSSRDICSIIDPQLMAEINCIILEKIGKNILKGDKVSNYEISKILKDVPIPHNGNIVKKVRVKAQTKSAQKINCRRGEYRYIVPSSNYCANIYKDEKGYRIEVISLFEVSKNGLAKDCLFSLAINDIVLYREDDESWGIYRIQKTDKGQNIIFLIDNNYAGPVSKVPLQFQRKISKKNCDRVKKIEVPWSWKSLHEDNACFNPFMESKKAKPILI